MHILKERVILINITLERNHDLGYIYLNSFADKFERVYSWQTRIRRYDLKELDNFYLQLSKLNWPQYSYDEAKLNGDFTEEYMYDRDQFGYLYGVERSFSRKEIQVIERYYNILKFEFNNESYYAANLDKPDNIFNNQHYVYHYNEGLYLVLALVDCQAQFSVVTTSFRERIIINTNHISRLKSVIFPEDSHYDIKNFTNIAVNVG
ncbi:hypothetical protein [Halanaerobium congolense]|uniref:hypothetical protein n=2 Tax=Halanaerobium congolense TaxID=54121 RepID=UPI00115FB0B6|nr:hypothetical protein [Halanaerobium congolense]